MNIYQHTKHTISRGEILTKIQVIQQLIQSNAAKERLHTEEVEVQRPKKKKNHKTEEILFLISLSTMY